jgi:hypothetical protein
LVERERPVEIADADEYMGKHRRPIVKKDDKSLQ